jgi:SAM-dependent methyltransferase
MILKNLITALKYPNKLSLFMFSRDGASFVRMHFLYSAYESGLLNALATPRGFDDLENLLQIKRPDMLKALLDLGTALKELSFRQGKYSLKGRRARTLARPDGDALAAVLQANVTYYNSIYRHAKDRLRGADQGDYLPWIGGMVARYSTLMEPYLRNFLKAAIPSTPDPRMLDIGCGSGMNLFSAHNANNGVHGIGLDMDADVVNHANTNMAAWNLNDRFHILQGDIRQPPDLVQGTFDVICMFNLVYYFPPESRIDLFKALKKRLSSGGVLAIVSTMQSQGRDYWAASLDMAVNSIKGCWPLPDLDELKDQIDQAGFREIEVKRIMPGGSLYGLTARIP